MKRAPKYRNRRVEANGEKFDSQAEALRWNELVCQQIAGRITGLTRQVSFVLAPGAVVAGKKKRALMYRADFQYVIDGKTIIEDKKGALTAVYKVKRHLMKTVHNIDILET